MIKTFQERNLRKLAELTNTKLAPVDVFFHLKAGHLFLWLSDDARTYTKHRLNRYTDPAQVSETYKLVTVTDIPPNQIGVRGHHYLETGDGEIASALSHWPLGFRALMTTEPLLTIDL